MTKWMCNACHTSPCYVENESCCIGTPTGCPYRLAPNSYWKPEWKRDCTTEEKMDELPEGIDWRMTTHYNVKRINDLEKKVQELIASGQGQMKRIQELERELKSHTNMVHARPMVVLEALDRERANSNKIHMLEKKIEQLDGHTHERFQCDV